jgi:hypothetical protein
MLLKRILATALLSIVLPSCAFCQEAVGGHLTVTSEPPGAEIFLRGDAALTGVTPSIFSQGLIGDYQLTLRKRGYENYSTRLVLDPFQKQQLSVSLVPKTRIKAAARSVFIPGWGQRYADKKTKGFVFTLLSLSSVAAFVVADQDFSDKFDTFEKRRSEFDEALTTPGTSRDELERQLRLLNDAQDEAYDAENIRRVTIATAIGVWALNVLDALVFFPEEHGTFSVKGLSLVPDVRDQTMKVTLSTRF